MKKVIEDVVVAKRLRRWAGHVARMDDCRLPKRLLFGWLPQWRPAHGTKQRWRDKVRKHLKQFGIEESSWSHKAQDRLYWRAVCKESLTACTEERQRKRSAHGWSSCCCRCPNTCCTSAGVPHLFQDIQEEARHCKIQVPDNSATHFLCNSGKCCLISVCHFVAEKHHLYQVAFFQGSRCVRSNFLPNTLESQKR